MPISLVLIDDNVLAREAIARLIREQPDLEVIAGVSSIDEALRTVRDFRPTAILLESRLRNHDSLSLMNAQHDDMPETKILVSGIRTRQGEVSDFVRAGAHGFVLKDASPAECFATIRAVAQGGHALPRQLTGLLFKEIAGHAALSSRGGELPGAHLTNREHQVIALIGEGLSNKEIASRLHVAVDTVRTHVASLLKKLRVRTRVHIAALQGTEANRLAPTSSHRNRNR